MTTWQAFFLGVVQGVTEFLPVSSSGHLALGQYFLGFENLHDYILFDLICHLGTLTAIFYFFFPVIKEIFSLYNPKFWYVVLGTLPLFPLVFILKPIKALFDQPQFLGPCFLVSAVLLFAALHYRFPPRHPSRFQWKDAMTIGVFQAAAIFPGVSRSGATISAACMLGWTKENAIQFSFLLAIPAILGGVVLESLQAFQSPAASLATLDFQACAVGFCTSALVGCGSLSLLKKVATTEKWSYFAWYCLILGLFTTFYFIMNPY